MYIYIYIYIYIYMCVYLIQNNYIIYFNVLRVTFYFYINKRLFFNLKTHFLTISSAIFTMRIIFTLIKTERIPPCGKLISY